MALLGKYCQELGITNESLKSFSMHIHPSKFTKGVALELFLHAKKKITKNPVDRCPEWFSNLLKLGLFCISKTTLKTKLYMIAAKKKNGWEGHQGLSG